MVEFNQILPNEENAEADQKLRIDPNRNNVPGDGIAVAVPMTSRNAGTTVELSRKEQPKLPKFVPNNWKIEKDYLEDYIAYKSGEKEALQRIIVKLRKVIETGVRTFGGGNPLLYPRARILVKEAIESYDPTKAPLKSHIMLNLQRLYRLNPQSTNIIKASEGDLILFKQIQDVEKEFQDTFGRPPSTQEIADRLGKSVRAIEQARTRLGAVNENTFQGNIGAVSISGTNELGAKEKLWIDAVYKGLSGVDQYIADCRYGLHGQKKKTLQEIARDLGMPLSTVANRAKKIEQEFRLPDNV
ncbi:MAG: hypothetical protein KatS3mg087_0082 [Patescibacteria group bacterium]|nr:MAG: hypothetical protein KatS3mg087_0082 [Patescibacteria group bacterium]